MTSAVLILPDAYRDAGNAFGVDQGWGPNCLAVALSGDGSEPATHWGCRADVGESFVAMVENPNPENEPLVAVLIYSFSDTLAPYDHWVETLASNNLTVVEFNEAAPETGF